MKNGSKERHLRPTENAACANSCHHTPNPAILLPVTLWPSTIMDRARFILDKVFLTDEASNRKTAAEGFGRRVISRGKHRPESMILSVLNGNHSLIKAICHRLRDSRWRLGHLDLNLPALVHGHNGRPIRSNDEVALALTRARHFLKIITTQESHHNLIPGLGRENYGYIHYLEAMIQIQDPGHRLLRASHVATLPHQHKSPMVCWGESTRFRSREADLSFYDKQAQRRRGRLHPEGIPCLRIERVLKNPERLARELVETGEFAAPPGEVVRSISLSSSNGVVRRTVARLSGWWESDTTGLAKLPTPARNLAVGLGARITSPHSVDAALDRYEAACNPCERTLRNVVRALRSYAALFTAQASLPSNVLPDPCALAVSELHDTRAESEYKSLFYHWGIPSVPDPDISDAWSMSSFIAKKPEANQLIGHTGPEPYMPWKDTF